MITITLTAETGEDARNQLIALLNNESAPAAPAAAAPVKKVVATAEPIITIEDLRSAAVTKPKDKVKEILGEFDASRITELAVENYQAFLDKINALA